MPQRANKVVVLAHCHLNVNTKVHGLAGYTGARTEVLRPYLEGGFGLVQLPCPEATYLGMKRWGMTWEQYDLASYRRHCARILRPTVDTLVELERDGCEITAVVGVDGSPSCGVNRTCEGYCGGAIDALCHPGAAPVERVAAHAGVFIEVLRSLLDEAGLELPFVGVDETP